MRARRWSPAEARDALAAPDIDRQVGVAVGVPVVVVDDVDATCADIGSRLASLPAVAVAVADADVAGEWDVATPDPGTAVEGVLSAPRAAVTATQVLRVTPGLDVAAGLTVESWAYASLQAGPEFLTWLADRGHRSRRDTDTPRVRLETEGDHTVIVLTRPRLHNLLDAAMRDELIEALRTVSLTDSQVVLRAEGPSFCAGGDPAEFGTVSDPATAHAIRSSSSVASWLHRVAERTTARIDGACVGAGVELAAFCSRLVAGPGARFRLPETRMGLIPGAGGTVSIPRRIGTRRTLEWLLAGSEIDAATALAWGLVDEIDGNVDRS